METLIARGVARLFCSWRSSARRPAWALDNSDCSPTADARDRRSRIPRCRLRQQRCQRGQDRGTGSDRPGDAMETTGCNQAKNALRAGDV